MAFPAGTKRLLHKGGKLVSSAGVALRPELVHAVAEATRDLPDGYRAEIFSGADARSTGTTNHPGGVAIDLRIVDPNGKQLPADGFDASLKLYEQLFQSVRIRAQYLFPGRNLTWIWGGAWISDAAGYGDRMHYQIHDPARPVSGASPGSGAYDPKTGINRSNAHASAFMSPDELANYQTLVKFKADSDYDSSIPAVPMTAAEALAGSVAAPPSSANFERCHPLIAKWEGEAFTNDPDDPGGPTKYGITQARLAESRGRPVTAAEVAALGKDEALAIYRKYYWTPLRCDEMQISLALMTYNTGVNSGPARGAEFLQRALNRQGAGLTEDGRIGPLTLSAAANCQNIPQAVRDFSAIYEAFYRSLATFGKYGRGWLNRLTDITNTALAWSGEPIQEPPVAEPQPSPGQTTVTIDLDVLAKKIAVEISKEIVKPMADAMVLALRQSGLVPALPSPTPQPEPEPEPKPEPKPEPVPPPAPPPAGDGAADIWAKVLGLVGLAASVWGQATGKMPVIGPEATTGATVAGASLISMLGGVLNVVSPTFGGIFNAVRGAVRGINESKK